MAHGPTCSFPLCIEQYGPHQAAEATGVQAMSQLAFAVLPPGAAELIASRLDLFTSALEDAAAWRESTGDDETAEAYQELAAALEEMAGA